MQDVGIVAMILFNLVRAIPQMFRISMLAPVFMPCIPFQNQISLLEIIRIFLPVKNLLYLVTRALSTT